MATDTTNNTTLDYALRYDIPKVTLSEVYAQIQAAIAHQQIRGCITLVGNAGTGKSQIFRHAGADLGWDVVTINTAQFSLLGAGVPCRADMNSGFFKIALPSMFEQIQTKPTILFFDEINRGNTHAIQMFFTLLEDRRIFDYTLPEHCLVTAAMNPATSQYKVTAMEGEMAFRRRLQLMYVTHSAVQWLAHAQTEKFHRFGSTFVRGKACHPAILNYFMAKTGEIYDGNALAQSKQACTPAAVETISEAAYLCDARKERLTSQFLYTKIAGVAGVRLAHALQQHFINENNTLSSLDILYHYDERIKAKILHLITTGSNETLLETLQNTATLLISQQIWPNTNSIPVINYFKFCNDCPAEIACSALSQLTYISTENNAKPYLDNIMRYIRNTPIWVELASKLNTQHTAMTEALDAAL